VSHDETGFAEFFQASWDPCLRAVAASTGDMLLAEDQVAEAFARAKAPWRKVSRYPAPRAWVVRTVAGAAAGTALALGLTGILGSAPAHGTATIRTAAFTIVSNPNGTTTLTINPSELLDPATLQSDLVQDGILAMITVDSFCSSDSAQAGFPQVVSFQSAGELTVTPQSGMHPAITIDPAAMPPASSRPPSRSSTRALTPAPAPRLARLAHPTARSCSTAAIPRRDQLPVATARSCPGAPTGAPGHP
jgi:hypothetical protein